MRKLQRTEKLYVYAILALLAYVVVISQMNLSLASTGVVALRGDYSGSSSGLTSLSAGASESEIVAAIVPQDSDFTRPYSWKGNVVTLSTSTPGNGYDMLANMDKEISTADMTPDQAARYQDMIKRTYHPCCDAPISACGCKHAVAAKGLIKKLIMDGWTDDDIQEEVFMWYRFWWPKHYAIMTTYLVSQGANPSEISFRDWNGDKLSTMRSEKAVRAALGL